MGWNDYTVGAESCVIFAYNRAGLGGAIVLLDLSGTLIVFFFFFFQGDLNTKQKKKIVQKPP